MLFQFGNLKEVVIFRPTQQEHGFALVLPVTRVCLVRLNPIAVRYGRLFLIAFGRACNRLAGNDCHGEKASYQ